METSDFIPESVDIVWELERKNSKPYLLYLGNSKDFTRKCLKLGILMSTSSKKFWEKFAFFTGCTYLISGIAQYRN